MPARQVEQTSGENWDDVKLTLSTARPRLNSSVPELYPWRLARWEPRLEDELEAQGGVFELSRFQVTAATGLSTNRLAAPPPPAEAYYDAELVSGIAQSGLLATTFEIPYTVSLPSKADGQKGCSKSPEECDYKHECFFCGKKDCKASTCPKKDMFRFS